MATIDLGKIKPVWKGTWAGSTAYEKNDMIAQGVNSYICTAAHTSDASTFSNDSANWDVMATGADIPEQSGNAGKVLQTDGSVLSWGESVPSQSGNAGKVLKTDGSSLSWGDGGKILQIKSSNSTTKFSSTGNVGVYYDNTSSTVGTQMLSVSMTRLSSTSRILVWGHSAGNAQGNQGACTALFADSTRLAMNMSNGYSQDSWDGGVHANVASSLVGAGAVTYQYRLLGTRDGSIASAYWYSSVSYNMGAFYTSLTVMEIEV